MTDSQNGGKIDPEVAVQIVAQQATRPAIPGWPGLVHLIVSIKNFTVVC
jgi:hypothetical protein